MQQSGGSAVKLAAFDDSAGAAKPNLRARP
jgi:hypothetical protein